MGLESYGIRVCVTGGGGFLGSVLVRELLSRHNEVYVIDECYFGKSGILYNTSYPNFHFIKGDVRNENLLRRTCSINHVDALIHLAALVGEPICSKYPEAAKSINVSGTDTAIDVVEKLGIHSFCHASTCSLYGWKKGLVDETSPLEPTSLYGTTKATSEKLVLSSSAPNVSVLRFGTLYGSSPRMRLDILLNQFVASAVLHPNRELEIFEPAAWRPILHVKDAAVAIMRAIANPRRKMTINIGYDNYRKIQLAKIVKARFPEERIVLRRSVRDRRSYRVQFGNLNSLGMAKSRMVSPQTAIDEIAGAARACSPYRASFDNVTVLAEPK